MYEDSLNYYPQQPIQPYSPGQGALTVPSYSQAPVANLGITPPAQSGMDWKTAGGIASSASQMGVGGLVGMGIGAGVGGPVGAVVGGTLGGIVDKGIQLWQGNKASNAQKKYLQQRQALNDRLAAADRAQTARQWQMNFGQTQQQIDFNQSKSAAEFRQTTWQNSLANLQNKANSDMNLRLTMMKAGMI
jgi:hypothetical protein